MTIDPTAKTAAPAPAPERLTLRKLIERLGPEFMDAELCVQMKDGHRNSEFAYLPTELSLMPRYEAHAPTGQPGRVTFTVFTSTKRFVKEKAA
jgi:hypothetical protein